MSRYLSRDDITEIRTRYRDLKKTQYNKDSVHLLSELYACTSSDIRRIVTSNDFPEIAHTTSRMVLENPQVIKRRCAKIRLLIRQGFGDKDIARQLQCSIYMVKKQRMTIAVIDNTKED